MYIITAIRLLLAFAVLFHITGQVIYFIGDVSDRYEDHDVTAQERDRYCDEVCSIPSVAKRYGKLAHDCEEACKPMSRRPLLSALRAAYQHYHLCGIDVPCIDAFFNFARSLTGGTIIVLGLLMIPNVLRAAANTLTFGMSSRLRLGRSGGEINPRIAVNGMTTVENIDDNDHEAFFKQQRNWMGGQRPRAQLEQTSWDSFKTWISTFKSASSSYLALERPHTQ